jgi:DsbC/DsbD-like thiol-disulfide interchange protein
MVEARHVTVACTIAAVVAAGDAAPVAGQFGLPVPSRSQAEELVNVRFLAGVRQVGPGERFHLACVFDVEPKWHIYWKDSGTGGPPPVITVKAPPGFEVGQVRWPRPQVFDGTVGEEYGYVGRTVLFVPVVAPDTLADGSAAFEARIDWAVCRNVCLIGGADRSVNVVTSSRPNGEGGAADGLLSRHLGRLPRPLKKLEGATLAFDGRVLTITGPAQGRSAARILPIESPGVTYDRAEVEVKNDRFRIVVPVQVQPRNALGRPLRVAGLVTLGTELDDPCYDFELSLTNSAPSRGVPDKGPLGDPGRPEESLQH